MLPFTREQFISLFASYNDAVWPVQILAYLVGIAMVAMLAHPSRKSDCIIGTGLAAMWAWTGIVYHWSFFSAINEAAWLFGALCVLQAGLLLHATLARGRLSFGAGGGLVGWLGWAFIVYASVVYPLVGLATGHRYPAMPMFGITPCPVTIFTFGLLLLATTRVSRWLLAIPLAWSLVGGSAASLLGVAQDWPLLFSGIAVVAIILRDRGKLRGALAA
jgi:hypothetical protein